ncbi:hypothetical protein BS17DRAFT_786966 [Gyrodon lividus]|nr:hypothetical protein BS17DRAFT_786966 [Gyrodon lividus]
MSGVIDASEHPDLDKDFNNPVVCVEVEQELDSEVREEEPSIVLGRTDKVHARPQSR